MTTLMRYAVASLVLMTHAVLASAVDLNRAVDFTIPAQKLDAALMEFSRQAKVQIVASTAELRDFDTVGATGNFTLSGALRKLLGDSGLSFTPVGESAISIGKRDEARADDASMMKDSSPAEIGLRLAQSNEASMSQAQGASTASEKAEEETDPAPAATEDEKLDEITVTAQRREQSAHDVPSALQVYSGRELDRLGKDEFEDYVFDVPSLSFRQQGSGSQRIAIRGVSNIAGGEYVVGDPASTVGLYLGDIALSSTAIMADVALYDLNRVEVLKGPQGTLYGEGAMGGAIKMILNKPDMQSYAVNGDVSLSSTKSGGLNNAVRGMVNIPLAVDKAALRIVGSHKSNEGFVDNVLTGQNNHNDTESWSARALLGMQLSEKFSAELLLLRDNQHHDDFSQIELAPGDLKISVAEPRFSDSEVSVAGLTLNYDLGAVNLTSISSFFQLDRTFNDTVPFVGSILTGFGVPPGLYTQESFVAGSVTESVAQELRLVSKGDNRLDWVAGAFYRSKELDADSHTPIPPDEFDPINEVLAAGGFDTFPTPTSSERHVKDEYEHVALYGELNLELAEKLELIAGLRWFDESIKDRDQFVFLGPFAPFTGPEVFNNNEADGFVPKAGLKYELTRDAMLYVQAAKGFRSPLYNIQLSAGVGDQGAESDELWSYEIGTKTVWADGRISLDASAYFVDWKDIQITFVEFSQSRNSNVGFVDNGGKAEVRGAELAFAAAPTDHFRFGLNVGYTDGEIVQGERGVVTGSVLPNAPEWTLSANAEYRFPLGDLGSGYIRLDGQFVDEQATKAITALNGVITNDGEFLPSFTLGNLRLGVESGNRWGVALFVDNLWDERARLGRGITSPNPTINPDRFTIARPRTIGISLRKTFF